MPIGKSLPFDAAGAVVLQVGSNADLGGANKTDVRLEGPAEHVHFEDAPRRARPGRRLCQHDLMYGGPLAWQFPPVLDCGHDDYFNPAGGAFPSGTKNLADEASLVPASAAAISAAVAQLREGAQPSQQQQFPPLVNDVVGGGPRR